MCDGKLIPAPSRAFCDESLSSSSGKTSPASLSDGAVAAICLVTVAAVAACILGMFVFRQFALKKAESRPNGVEM